MMGAMGDVAAAATGDPGRRSSRAGGRAALAAPLAEDLRPIRPGMKGRQYRPPSDAGVRMFHPSALEVPEVIGLSNAPSSGVEILHMVAGGEEEWQALLIAGCAQKHRFCDLPGGAASGISDSRPPDMRAGRETGITNALAGLSGLNMIYDSVGRHASLPGFCFEGLVPGDDVLAQVMRLVRGSDVTPDSTSIDAMKDAALRAGSI